MRIALDVSIQSTSQPTGVERAQAVLIDALLAHAPALELHLMGGEQLPPRWAGHARVVHHEGRGGASWRYMQLARQVNRLGPALLHLPVAAAPARVQVPMIATLHELPWAEPGAPGDRSLRHRVATWLSARRAARLVCPSERTASQARALFPACAERLVVMPHAVDPRFSEDAPDDRAARVELAARGIPDPGDYVLALGRLRHKKNLAMLIAAWRALPCEGRPAALVLAGPDGDASSALREQLARPGARVLCPGFVPDALLPSLVRGARVLAAPALLEGFGLTPLEAMAAGVPVLAARQGPVDEAVGEAALRVDGGDPEALSQALDALLNDGALRARQRAAGRLQAARRSPAALARATCALYEQLA
ncbi:MAG: hypothetical protein DRQ55_02115 [Planctomycetota bacterium]|nr:MAG: hypothetical protein DRQ55_02115 [Planctomycetota bacterium]